MPEQDPTLDTASDADAGDTGRAAPVDGRTRSAIAAAARLARHLELSLASVDLTLPQFRLMLLLVDEPGVANQLARRTQVRPPSLTALVSGLVERGLVERRPDESDRRRVVLAATDDGRRILDDGFAAIDDRLREITGDGPADDPIGALATWIPALDEWRDGR